MFEPLVSVKMITYNHAAFIEKAIEGVLQQKSDFPFELVIGEDCSTDGTREIVFAYQSKYPDIIRVVTSDNNVGMKKNGIRTLAACSGKYIAFCEGDDYWHNSEKLQKQVDFFEGHPECGLVYSSYDVYHVKSGERIKDFIKYKRWEMPDDCTLHDFIAGKNEIGYGVLTCTVMVPRILCWNIIESDPYLYQSDHFLMGDTQLWAEIATKAHLHYIPESLATHTITEESATRSRDVRKKLRFSISQSEMMLYLCEKYGVPSVSRNIYEKIWCDSTLRLAFHTRNAELAEEVLGKKKTLTAGEWLFYLGASNPIFYYPFRLAALFRNLFRKAHNPWK